MRLLLKGVCLVLCLVLLCLAAPARAMVSESLWGNLLYGSSSSSSSGSNSSYIDQGLWDTLGDDATDTSYLDQYTYSGGYPGPEFPYISLDCEANQKLSTRTGPGTQYTETGTFSSQTEVVVFYQTDRDSSVPWGYVEFYYKSKLYRVYTGMKRLNVTRTVPADDETVYNYVTLLKDFKPYYGPGYDYATLAKTVKAGSTVPAFFTDTGWGMFDYELSNGQLQRGWAPPDYWR